jgi:glycosyltransferase involved in cell wall biosynthesis
VPSSSQVRSLLLVRNGVDHDARVLRAARVAGRILGGATLVAGVATAASPAGPATVEGVSVVRLPARPRASRLPVVRPRRHTDHTRPAPPEGLAGSTGVPRLTVTARARRVLSGLSFSLQALVLARRIRPKLVHANDWNTMWAGLLIKSLCGSRLVYDSHELWADRNGRWEWRPWLLACEALFVRAADEVLTSSPGYADALAARYRIPRPAVVRNIPETPPITTQDPHATAPNPIAALNHLAAPANHAPPRSRPTEGLVVYIGGLMPGRGLEQMIDALPLIPEARLRAVGPGAPHYRASLLAHAQATGVLDRVELRQPVAPTEVGGILAEAAAGLCLIQPICRSYELSLPNKLFEYAAAGVPVLASDLPVIAAIVRSDGLGEIAPAGEHPEAIAASLRRLLEPESWALTAQRVRAFSTAHGWAGEARTLEGIYFPRPC